MIHDIYTLFPLTNRYGVSSGEEAPYHDKEGGGTMCRRPQSIEKPFLQPKADWVSNVYERKNRKAKRWKHISPSPGACFYKLMAVILAYHCSVVLYFPVLQLFFHHVFLLALVYASDLFILSDFFIASAMKPIFLLSWKRCAFSNSIFTAILRAAEIISSSQRENPVLEFSKWRISS